MFLGRQARLACVPLKPQTAQDRRLDGVSFIGLRKAFWLTKGARGWHWELEYADLPRRCRWAWDRFRSYRDATRHRRNWSRHRKIGKVNRKRLRREREAGETLKACLWLGSTGGMSFPSEAGARHG